MGSVSKCFTTEVHSINCLFIRIIFPSVSQEIQDYLNASYHHPEESEMLANMTLALNISLTPNEVTSLAARINETVRNLTNVDAILRAARNDELNAMDLKRQALEAKYVLKDFFDCSLRCDSF